MNDLAHIFTKIMKSQFLNKCQISILLSKGQIVEAQVQNNSR